MPGIVNSVKTLRLGRSLALEENLLLLLSQICTVSNYRLDIDVFISSQMLLSLLIRKPSVCNVQW